MKNIRNCNHEEYIQFWTCIFFCGGCLKSAKRTINSLNQLFTPKVTSLNVTEKAGLNIARRSAFDIDLADLTVDSEPVDKRSINELKELLKREAPDDKVNVKVVKGAAVIPQGASVQSIAIPPLIALNNNLSDIPVPIPNTSVVHYAKINTLIRKP